jgi:hypothetical protein
MKAKKMPYLVDETLTPHNAAERGYEFVDEVFNPYYAIEEILDFAESRGYQFGVSKGKKDINQVFGLYRRTTKD